MTADRGGGPSRECSSRFLFTTVHWKSFVYRGNRKIALDGDNFNADRPRGPALFDFIIDSSLRLSYSGRVVIVKRVHRLEARQPLLCIPETRLEL